MRFSYCSLHNLNSRLLTWRPDAESSGMVTIDEATVGDSLSVVELFNLFNFF